ncbi:hypothetical protein PHPALM_28547 [Phytophthora palmivora]|uniref:Uncharacterized protein n=1 Tax=Phytophthora palmivora TaxID=4796 RepID=A0A2P4X9W6_9STRA|nr:hypothetical protein PHPALM_28547 [Phytophthora palmivora]
MLFTRPSGVWEQDSPAWTTGSISSSPRRVVTFAVQNAPPSPLVYRSRQPQEPSPYTADRTTAISPTQLRLRRTRRQLKKQNDAQNVRPAAASKLRSRRPGWDADVSHNSTLFDASLKKSLLFQPRAGDRKKEEDVEQQQVVRRRKKESAARTTPVRYRSGPSSVYAQQRNMTHLPHRRTKDFVRQNIEHLTGRPMSARSGRSGTQLANRENVFERLSAPRVSKALLRSHVLLTQPDRERSPRPVRSPSVSSFSPPRPSPVQSPLLTIDPPSPDKQNSPRSATPSSGRRMGVGWSSPYSSPQRFQQPSSSRHSPVPHSNTTNRSSSAGSRTRRYDNYPARVFGVLDRENGKRIGVSQILQGLRLLGLPATHNQISDYVYLIHEGRHNSIDLEEWEILAIVSTEHQPIPEDDPYLEEIQNRIEGMFERAQTTAALRWTSAPVNNQFENDPDHSRSDRILKRAASVVYSLRASLFPLVHQAEATLREIQQRHGSKLSLFLPPGDMASIAQNSDVLASAILDDILLDTVQLLNDEDKQQSRRQLEAHHSDQLDDILNRIHEIEREEDAMIQQGLVLSYKTPGTKCDLPTTKFHSQQTLFAGTPVRTSILQGKRLQFIERRRHKFQHHRRLVESSLAETGMAQFAIIEILEEMLLDDLVEDTAAELHDTVMSMSETLLTKLL